MSIRTYQKLHEQTYAEVEKGEIIIYSNSGKVLDRFDSADIIDIVYDFWKLQHKDLSAKQTKKLLSL